MTYNEALELKNKMPNSYVDAGFTCTPLVVPEIEDDRINFLSDYQKGNADQSDVKKYSTDGEFIVCGISLSGSNVNYHRLT